MNSPALDPIAHLRRRGRRLVVGPSDGTPHRTVYAITHLHVPELAAMPALDVARARPALEQRRDLEQRLAYCQTAEQRAAVEHEMEVQRSHLQEQLQADLFGTPERLAAYIERCRALVVGAVEAVGLALPDAPTGPCPEGTMPEQVCTQLGVRPGNQEPVYLKPVQIVTGRAETADQLSILDWRDGEVCRLAMLFSRAFSVQAQVTPLSGGSGGPGVGGQARDPLRRPAQQLPADRRPLAGGSGGHSV